MHTTTTTRTVPPTTFLFGAENTVREAWAEEKSAAGKSLDRWILIAGYLAEGRAAHKGNVQFSKFLVAAGLDDMDPTTRADAIKLGQVLPLSEALMTTLVEAGIAHPTVVLPRLREAGLVAATMNRAQRRSASKLGYSGVPYTQASDVVRKAQEAFKMLRELYADGQSDAYGPLRVHDDHAQIEEYFRSLDPADPDYSSMKSWLNRNGAEGVRFFNEDRKIGEQCSDAFSALARGRRQLSWPPGDNYPGRLEAGNEFIGEAGQRPFLVAALRPCCAERRR